MNRIFGAGKIMRMIMGTPSERQLLWDRRMAEIDRRSMIAEAIAEGKEEGKAQGKAEGRAEGEKRLAELMAKLIEMDRMDDVKKSINDTEYRELLYQELF